MGLMHKFGEVILAEVQYVDTFEVKDRPALVLFEEYGNVVVAGITSNTEMIGIPLTEKEGIKEESIIKLNYIFTIPEKKIKRTLLTLSENKKRLFISEFMKRLNN